MKIFLDTIGCRLNQSEIEKYALEFRAAGHTLVSSAQQADLVVINTCAVTASAASDSRQKIRQAARVTEGQIVLTGCWSTLEPEAALKLPRVSQVVSNLGKDSLVAQVLGLPEETFDLEPLARKPLPGAHQRTRAFLKVQDGCDNHCTFCITRIARGSGRSRPVQQVLLDVQADLAGGTHEVVLSGVHLGSWGHDFTPSVHLFDLIREILAQTQVERLRLSSLEPWDLDERFFSLWKDARMCRHLHLPLQSGCAATLRRMARKISPDSFEKLLEHARRQVPEMAVTTDIIVGFPGETEAEFAESLEFVRRMNFSGGHVFSYSPRPGTAALKLPGQLEKAVIKERSAAMREVLADSSLKYNRRFVGNELKVLWEATNAYGPEGWQLQGLTDNYIRVTTTAPERLSNRFNRVRISKADQDGAVGVILPDK